MSNEAADNTTDTRTSREGATRDDHLARLVFRNGPCRGKVVTLGDFTDGSDGSGGSAGASPRRDQRVRIGRNGKNDIVIDVGMIVSSFHAVITYRAEDKTWWVEDLDSKNGTYLNGAKIRRAQVRDGDIISLALTGPEVQFTRGRPELPSIFETTRSTFQRTRSVEAAIREFLPRPSSQTPVSLSGVQRAVDDRLVKLDNRGRWIIVSSVATLLIVVALGIVFVYGPGVGAGSVDGASETAASPEATTPSTALELDVELQPIYGSLFLAYRDQPIGKVTVSHPGPTTVEGLELRFGFVRPLPTSPSFLVEPFVSELPPLSSGESTSVDLLPKLSNDVLAPVTREVTAFVELRQGPEVVERIERAIFIHGRNVFNWQETQRITAFVDPQDVAVREFVDAVWRHCPASDSAEFPPVHFRRAVCLITGLTRLGLGYLPDARTPISSKVDWEANDTVSYPWETLVSRTGDCDDLTVLCAAVLERVRIPAAIVVAPRHVFVMFDSGLDAAGLEASPFDPDSVVVWEDRVWVPLETTVLGEKDPSFRKMWAKGRARREVVSSGEAVVVEVRDGWERFLPMNPNPSERTLRKIDGESWVEPDLEEHVSLELQGLEELFETSFQRKIRDVVEHEEPGRPRARALGELYARSGLFDRAQEYFHEALFGAPATPGSTPLRQSVAQLPGDDPEVLDLLFNYGICLTLAASEKEDYQRAADCYEVALERLPEDDGYPERGEFMLRLALVHHLRGDLASERAWSEKAYGVDPTLEETYAQLIAGDGARASDDMPEVRRFILSGLRS